MNNRYTWLMLLYLTTTASTIHSQENTTRFGNVLAKKHTVIDKIKGCNIVSSESYIIAQEEEFFSIINRKNRYAQESIIPCNDRAYYNNPTAIVNDTYLLYYTANPKNSIAVQHIKKDSNRAAIKLDAEQYGKFTNLHGIPYTQNKISFVRSNTYNSKIAIMNIEKEKIETVWHPEIRDEILNAIPSNQGNVIWYSTLSLYDAKIGIYDIRSNKSTTLIEKLDYQSNITFNPNDTRLVVKKEKNFLIYNIVGSKTEMVLSLAQENTSHTTNCAFFIDNETLVYKIKNIDGTNTFYTRQFSSSNQAQFLESPITNFYYFNYHEKTSLLFGATMPQIFNLKVDTVYDFSNQQ